MCLTRFGLLVTALSGLVLFAFAGACGSNKTSQYANGGSGGSTTGSGGTGVCFTNCGSGGTGAGSSATGEGGTGEGGPPCTGCQVDPCIAQGMPPTTITGKVYNPGGTLPLYNVYVYVPNDQPLPIDPGNPTCTQCEAPASGSPIVGTLTDETGSFTLAQVTTPTVQGYGVPSGANVPLVIQTGKWRTQITLPNVTACGTTAIPDPANPVDKLRLPANSSEGDMPLIAFTSGCDPAECFLLNTVGISASEFVPPTAPLPVAYPNNTNPAAGHVHFFTAYNNTAGGGGPGGPGGAASASAVTGGNTPTDTYAWWQSAANLQQYDIIFNACECNPNARGATANAAMDAYLINGGRLFATHYYYNWFTPSPPATADLASVVDWTIPQNATIVNSEADAIDTTFPIGMAFATWLQDNGVTTTLGAITLADTRNDMGGLTPAGCSEVAGTCLATQWIYDPVNNDPRYISFNTPVGPPSNAQCGKAVFSDVHLSGTSNDQVFPAECSNPGIDSPPGHAVNEKALLFLFFDLSACVQNESSPPTIPPPAAGTQPK